MKQQLLFWEYCCFWSGPAIDHGKASIKPVTHIKYDCQLPHISYRHNQVMKLYPTRKGHSVTYCCAAAVQARYVNLLHKSWYYPHMASAEVLYVYHKLRGFYVWLTGAKGRGIYLSFCVYF